jgi:UDP-glucose 4-epimerase
MNQRVLITGGLGYIGGRLAAEMVKAGVSVRLGTRNASQPLPTQLVTCEVAAMDFNSPASLQAACAGVTQIVHLAALNDADCARDPEAAININVLGTFRLLEAARAAGVERFLYASTAHVYRSPLVGEVSEATVPLPSHMYGITHKGAEDLVLAADARKQLTGIVLRLANGFGAPLHPKVNSWGLLVNDLCRQAVTVRSLTLKSTGAQQRNFVTLSDVTRAMQHFLNIPAAAVAGATRPTSDCSQRLFNIGGRKSLTVLQMTELIADRCERVLGFRPPIQRVPGDEVAPALQFSIVRSEASGFTPADDYAAEIDDCLLFCKKHFASS